MRLLITLLALSLLALGDAAQATPATITANTAGVRPKSRFRSPAKALRPLHKRSKHCRRKSLK